MKALKTQRDVWINKKNALICKRTAELISFEFVAWASMKLPMFASTMMTVTVHKKENVFLSVSVDSCFESLARQSRPLGNASFLRLGEWWIVYTLKEDKSKATKRWNGPSSGRPGRAINLFSMADMASETIKINPWLKAKNESVLLESGSKLRANRKKWSYANEREDAFDPIPFFWYFMVWIMFAVGNPPRCHTVGDYYKCLN